jgi:glycosyltransferase involved in cell wall biosynthesis
MRIGIDITFLVANYPGTGIYFYIRRMLESLYRTANDESISLFFADYPKLINPVKYAEVKSFFKSWPLRGWKLPRWAYKIRLGLSAYSRMEVFHYPSDCIFYENVPHRANVFTLPDLTFIHYPEHHRSETVNVWGKFCERAVEHGDMILTYSEHTRQDIVRTLGVPGTKIRVTPLAAGSEFQPIPDKTLLRSKLSLFDLQDQKYILSVGTLEPRKNQACLIRAFARLAQRDKSLPHKLVFVGGRGWKYESIFETVKKMGLEDRVVFLGYSDPLEVLYNGADLMVYPSLYEGFGLPPLEAMSCGTPVITSNRSSLPEVVGDAALIVEPEDEITLSETMYQVLQDKTIRERLAEKGVQRAREFSWERTARTTLAAYNEAYRMKA